MDFFAGLDFLSETGRKPSPESGGEDTKMVEKISKA